MLMIGNRLLRLLLVTGSCCAHPRGRVGRFRAVDGCEGDNLQPCLEKQLL
jgi:hypothetical protein